MYEIVNKPTGRSDPSEGQDRPKNVGLRLLVLASACRVKTLLNTTHSLQLTLFSVLAGARNVRACTASLTCSRSCSIYWHWKRHHRPPDIIERKSGRSRGDLARRDGKGRERLRKRIRKVDIDSFHSHSFVHCLSSATLILTHSVPFCTHNLPETMHVDLNPGCILRYKPSSRLWTLKKGEKETYSLYLDFLGILILITTPAV